MVEEYISRDELLKLYVDGKYDTAEYHVSVPVIIQNIKDIPAADVRPVRRGKWVPVVAANEDGSPYQAGIHCSECGHFDVWEFNFCPDCGADMREES